MPLFVATFEVGDIDAWEKGFRTRGALFSRQSIVSPVSYAASAETNRVVLTGKVDDLKVLEQELADPTAAAAMEADGIKEGSFEFFIAEKRLDF